MTEFYKNQTSGEIQEAVKNEFNKIEKRNGRGIRDDKEVALAGMNVCDDIIKRIQKDPTKASHSPWAMKAIEDLRKQLKEKHDKLSGFNLLINSEREIHDVAQDIDNIENETLERLKRVKTVEESRKIVEKSKKIHNGTDMLVMEGGNDMSKQTGAMIFTAATNKIPIHEALKGLFDDNPNIVYQIDYSKCETKSDGGRGGRIKEKMTKLIGSKKCYLSYDSNKKTYIIRDREKTIEERALIWEGVKIIPDGVRQWASYDESKKSKENMGNIDEGEAHKLTKDLLKDMPSTKKLSQAQRNKIISETEKRLNKLLIDAKDHKYGLQAECISKIWFKSGLMELHLISGDSSRKDVTIWEDEKTLGKELYDFLGDEETEYEAYLTNRVRAIRQGMDHLTKVDEIDLSFKKNETKIENGKKEQMLYGIELFETMINNYKENEGSSTIAGYLGLYGDDNHIEAIKELIETAKHSIKGNDKDFGKESIINKIIKPIRARWCNFTKLEKYHTVGGRSTENPYYKEQYSNLLKVFFSEDAYTQEKAIRNLGDKSMTSFLADKKVERSKSGYGGLEVKDSNVNRCIDRIETWFKKKSIYEETVSGELKLNSNNEPIINEEVKKKYDYVLSMANDGFKHNIIDFFVREGMLPENWENEKDEVFKFVEKRQNQLKSINEQINNFPENINTLREKQHREKLKLEQKENKTEADMQKLQGLTYLEEHPEEQDRENRITLNIMKNGIKYGSLEQITKTCIYPALVELGGGTNDEVVNDIRGYGLLDLSDENAKIAGEVITEIAITVAVAVVTGGTGEVAIAGLLRLGSLASKATKYANFASKIAKVIEAGYKDLNITGKGTKLLISSSKLLISSSKLLIEGTTFNAASDMVHSAINGTSLDNLDINPISKKNIQTAAFLGALSIGNKIGMKALSSVHGKTRIEAFSKAGLEDIVKNYKGIWTESLVAEAAAMFGAEQGLSFAFGHDIINPETGEIETSHIPEWPTQQERTQMIGMLLAFKAIRPKLWQQYAEKINNGTLEICRSVKKNEILLKDTKTGETEKIQDLIDGKSKSNVKKGKKTEKGRTTTDTQNNKVIDKATEKLHKDFDQEIMSENGITIDGITYKLERRPNEGHNQSHKGRVVYTETGFDGKVKIKIDANSDTFSLPENSNGNNIRERYNAARKKYVDKNLNTAIEPAKQELDTELSKNIDLKTGTLEGKKQNKESLEQKKKNLSDEINQLKSRKAQLEQQLQNISKELTIQPEISSLKDIYSIIREGNIISIGGKKMKFIGVKGNKLVFTEGKGKTKEFSTFKELQDAKANFNYDIKNRQSERGLEQQIKFEELVEKEARTKNANEIIRKYEELQKQKAQIEQDIRDGFFRENADRLVGKHIRIDGVEYQCTGKNINNGKTTLDFKQTDGSNHFTISSFEQLKSKGQVNGFGDRYNVIDKETRAAGRELSKYERENHELLRGNSKDTGLFNGETEYVSKKKQALQQVEQQLQNDRANYDNAKLATNPKKVSNPEYERIQKEIEGVNSQLIEKGNELLNTEKDLGTSDAEIHALEEEITNLKAEKSNLINNEGTRDVSEGTRDVSEGTRDVNEGTRDVSEGTRDISEGNSRIENPDGIKNKLDETFTEAKSNGNIKLDWVTQKMFETGVYIEGLGKRFKSVKKLPIEFLKKIRDNLVDMKNKCRENLNEKYRNLIERWDKYIERKISEGGKEAEIKEEEIKELEGERAAEAKEEMVVEVEIKETDTPEVIAEKLEKSMENNADFDISQEAFESGRFIEGAKNRTNKNINNPDYSLPKSSIKRLYNKITEMMKKCGKNLSEVTKKYTERFLRFLDNLGKQPGEVVKMDGFERGVNTKKRSIEKVNRESDVIAIGDLHGDLGALKGNLEFAGLAREINGHLEWTGGKRKIVFQGDILADRGTDGLRIIQEIHQLREQARKQGGDIDIIVGNHDDFMISFLTGCNGNRFDKASPIDWARYKGQGIGLTELAQFIGGKKGERGKINYQNREIILQRMRETKVGRLILEEICNMKIVSQVDDVLYFHTNPTPEMLKILTNGNVQNNIKTINEKYQGFLRKALLGEGNQTISIEEFNQISDTFLSTSNRAPDRENPEQKEGETPTQTRKRAKKEYKDYINGIKPYMSTLRKNGINMISHGHNGGNGYRNTRVGGVRIVDTDYSYGHKGNYGTEHSVSVIKAGKGTNFVGDYVETYEDRGLHQGEEIELINTKERAIIFEYDQYTGEFTIRSLKSGKERKVAREMFTFIQDYKFGDEVYVKRTDGSESRAIITGYDPIKNTYKVTFNEGGLIKEKSDMRRVDLRNTKKQRYSVGERVYIRTSGGDEIKAKIESYDDKTKKYTATYEYGGKTYKISDITLDNIRDLYKPKYEIGSEVFVQLRNRSIIRARITDYNPETNIYRFEWRDSKGTRYYDDASPEMLRNVGIKIYEIGEYVRIGDTNEIGQVTRYDPFNNVYRVRSTATPYISTKLPMERLRPAA